MDSLNIEEYFYANLRRNPKNNSFLEEFWGNKFATRHGLCFFTSTKRWEVQEPKPTTNRKWIRTIEMDGASDSLDTNCYFLRKKEKDKTKRRHCIHCGPSNIRTRQGNIGKHYLCVVYWWVFVGWLIYLTELSLFGLYAILWLSVH